MDDKKFKPGDHVCFPYTGEDDIFVGWVYGRVVNVDGHRSYVNDVQDEYIYEVDNDLLRPAKFKPGETVLAESFSTVTEKLH